MKEWPQIVWNGRIRDAFALAADAAKPGTRTFHAYGIAWGWTFIGFVFCVHLPYRDVSETRTPDETEEEGNG